MRKRHVIPFAFMWKDGFAKSTGEKTVMHANFDRVRRIRVHTVSSVKESLLFVRAEKIVVGRVGHQLGLSDRAGGRRNSSSFGI
jgi:hypothetical protein